MSSIKADDNSDCFVREATVADAAFIAIHRSSMFQDMGVITTEGVPELQALTREYLSRAMPAGEYRAWVACSKANPELVVGGAGLLLRQIPPFPIMFGRLKGTVAAGKQGLVMNVYVDRAWRRRGLANMLMQEIMAFAKSDGVESLVLHASSEGRPLYEQLGFMPTNEMRFVET